MNLRSDELNIDTVNAALAQVKGLDLPEVTQMVNKSNQVKAIDPNTLHIEDTNNLVGSIMGGEIKEQLDPKVPIYEGKGKPSVRPKARTAFEAIRDKHIGALAEAKTFVEFRDVLDEFRDDLKRVKKKTQVVRTCEQIQEDLENAGGGVQVNITQVTGKDETEMKFMVFSSSNRRKYSGPPIPFKDIKPLRRKMEKEIQASIDKNFDSTAKKYGFK